MGLEAAGPGQWVLAGARWGGRESPLTGGRVGGWKGQWFGLEVPPESMVPWGHGRPHPWLPYCRRRRPIVLRQRVLGLQVEEA